MGRIRSKDTTPELAVRRVLFRQGLRYRLHVRKLPGCPDMVFPKYSTVLFINGCFWHGHPCRSAMGKKMPQTNANFWCLKVQRNIERQNVATLALRELGWRVFCIWECETKDIKPISELKLLITENSVNDVP